MGHIVNGNGSLFFSSCEHITANGPSDLMEFPKTALRGGHCD